jgi:hypothetical protein
MCGNIGYCGYRLSGGGGASAHRSEQHQAAPAQHNVGRDLERDVDYDPDVADLLGTAGSAGGGAVDTDALRQRMTEYCDKQEVGVEALRGMMAPRLGRDEPARVQFREYDPGAAFVRPGSRCACAGLCLFTFLPQLSRLVRATQPALLL